MGNRSLQQRACKEISSGRAGLTAHAGRGVVVHAQWDGAYGFFPLEPSAEEGQRRDGGSGERREECGLALAWESLSF